MQVVDLKLKGLKLIKPKFFQDNRGYFLETFQKSLYEGFDMSGPFPQDNHSFSRKGCIRGMHFQSYPGQAKLVRAASGQIFDVAVDIRPDSPTFGQWEGVFLDGKEHHQLFLPVGFAHGFCVVSEEAHVMYKVSAPYNAAYEKGFRWNDPDVNIKWPVAEPLVSARDTDSPLFKELKFDAW